MQAQRVATAAAVLLATSSLVVPALGCRPHHGDTTSFVEVLTEPGKEVDRVFLSGGQTNGGCCEH